MENKEKEFMTFEKALEVVRELSSSQGFYGRLLQNMEDMTEDEKAELEQDLEHNKVKDRMDLIFYFEC